MWVAPKRFGYGAGLPIAWQDWAVLVAYLAAMIGAGALAMPRWPLVATVAMIAATALFVAISRRRTRGGWRWRSGGQT